MALNVKNLNSVLDEAAALQGMGIQIKEITRDGDRAVYAAEIPAQGHVTSHYHPKLDGGTEWYQVIEAGEDAVMHTGKPIIENDEVVKVEWDEPSPITVGDFFIVPNGVVHSLVAGQKRLRFVFGCPDAHLDNSKDKVVLEKFPAPEII
jgi:oxalate decarboxylase/phosphoglucose isomerase-like protein (cupin superfamily)